MSLEKTLLAGLAGALTMAGSLARADGGPRGLLAALGWDLPGGADDIGLAALDLDRLGDRLETWRRLESDPSSSAADTAVALAELADAVVDLLDELGDLRLQAPQDYLQRTRIRDEFLTRTFDLFTIQTVAVSARAAFDVALLLGVFELTRLPADPARRQVAHLRHTVHWGRLATLVTDPSALLAEVYGWGTPAFDPDVLVRRIGAVVQHVAAEVRQRPLPAIPLARLHSAPAPPPGPAPLQVLLPLLGSAGALDGEIGVSVFGLPPTTPGRADGGIGLAPYAAGAATLRVPFSSTLSLGMTADADLGSGFALVLRPGTDPVLRTGLNLAAAGTAGAGAALLVDLTATRPAGTDPMTLLSAVGVTLTARSVALEVRTDVDAGGADAGIRLRITGGRFAVRPDGLPFLDSAVPAESLAVDADLDVSWSRRGGLRLGGEVGMAATTAVGRSLGPVRLDLLDVALRTQGSDGVALAVGLGLTVRLGPVQLAVTGLGVRAALGPGPGTLGSADLSVRPAMPTRIGLAVDAGPVSGGGVLVADPEHGQYAGEVHLQFEGIAVRAIGLLTTRLPDGRPGFALLVLVSAEFPPVQLGLGFMLVGVGGFLGINRTVAVEALRAGLKAGALGAVLSPPDPKADPAQLVATLAGLFPPAAGRHVFAPTARIVWGSPVLITIDLCLVLELPSPVRLVALGRMRALLPAERDPVVRLQVDVLGVIDFDQQTAAVDATLIDSRIAQFALTGDLALRMSWGPDPAFLLAVGGFHPRFVAPPGFPALDRVAVALAGGDNPKLRLEAYLALTSNTVQFGARLDVGARAGSFSIGGFMAFDALVTLSPLAFVVDIAATLAVKAGSHTLFSISLALTLSGPRPWHAHGRASFSILFFDVSFGFDVTIGDDTPTALPDPVDVAPLLLAALADARAWAAQLPAGADAVTLRAVDAGTAILAHPLATLRVRQRVAPLDRVLDRFGTGVPSGAKRFRITLATVGGIRTTLTPLQDRFAPAQFTAMSDDQKLSAASFEAMTSGAALGADGYSTGAPVTVGVAYEQALFTADDVAPPSRQRLPLPLDVFAVLTATTPAPAPAFALRDDA